MDLMRDSHTIELAGQTVEVKGETGAVEATWTLLIDGELVDRAKASGRFTLRSQLRDGSEVSADVYQSAIGPTEVTICRDGEALVTKRGFVA
jgi:hypothetical protein